MLRVGERNPDAQTQRISQKQDQESHRRQHEPEAEPVAIDLQPVPRRDVAHRPPWLWVRAQSQPLTKSRKVTPMPSRRSYGELSSDARRRAAMLAAPGLHSAIDALQLPFGNRDRALGVLAAGAEVREHIDHQEVGDRGRRLFAGLADAGGRKRALAGLAEHRVLRSAFHTGEAS